MRGSVPKLAGLTLLLLAVLLLGGPLWKGYLQELGRHGGVLYAPRERLGGSNEAPTPRVTPASESIEAGALESAAAYAEEHSSRALIVTRHDHIVFERYWQGSSFNTLTDAQQFTPVLAALTAGVALTHRRLGWPDEPVGLLITEWSADPRGAISVRNLLQMSSGLAAQSAATGADLTTALLARPLSGTPGAHRLEQPADPQLLALTLERATQQRYAEYVSYALWRSIGAGDAWFWVDRPGGLVHAECCLLARQGDWIRIAQLLLRDGNYRGDELIRPGWIAQLRSPAPGDTRFGAYLRLASLPPGAGEPYLARDLYVLGGEGGNRLWLVPSLDLAILCTATVTRRDARWEDARIPNLIVRGTRDFHPPTAPVQTDLSSLVPGH